MPVLTNPRWEELCARLKRGAMIVHAAHDLCIPFERYHSGLPGFYVYLICDPDTEETFYVGKGCKKRCIVHWRAFLKLSLKNGGLIERFAAIRERGAQPIYLIIESGLTEPAALHLERMIIHSIGLDKLANRMPGERSEDESALQWARGLLAMVGEQFKPHIWSNRPDIQRSAQHRAHYDMVAELKAVIALCEQKMGF